MLLKANHRSNLVSTQKVAKENMGLEKILLVCRALAKTDFMVLCKTGRQFPMGKTKFLYTIENIIYIVCADEK